MCLVAALASWLRGGKFVHEEAHAIHSHHKPRHAQNRQVGVVKEPARD
jgi:hypothetical protein